MDMNQFWASMLSLQLFPFIRQNTVHIEEKPEKVEDYCEKSSSKKYQRTWKKQEIESIFNRTTEYCKVYKKKIEELTIKDYMIIGENFPQRPEQIMLKITEIHNTGTLRPGIWSTSEDQLLTDLLHKGKERWGQIARIINKEVHSNLNVRSGKQCKERWNNYLNPSINRNPWTGQEDSHLLRLYKEHGQKWSLIAKFIKNRTEGAVKNRIKSLVNRIQQDLPNQHNLDTGIDEFIRRSASDTTTDLDVAEIKDEDNQ